ncbi:MAG: HK97 family phage prohead protease [Ruminococcus flavefaciens]|nr:HK97 family phage prohead protease [Ruminococcus flavefaciens]
MKIEKRADGLHITGYVNVTGKLSRPVVTPHGKVLETIEERAFNRAIKKSGEITLTVDHDSTAYARTSDGTLKLSEDAIGLRADCLITDENVMEMAHRGKIKGWSFGMYNVVDELEQRTEGLPIRHVKDFTLDHITLVKDKIPCYSATSVEYRADSLTDVESRAIDIIPEYSEKPDYTKYIERLRKINA